MTDKLKSQAQVLISCAVASLTSIGPATDIQMDHISLCMVQAGLERGLISPDSAMEFVVERFGAHRGCKGFQNKNLFGCFTVLETFFIEGLFRSCQGQHDVDWIGNILEALLLHEANLDFTLSFKKQWKEHHHISLRAGQKYVGEALCCITGVNEKDLQLSSNFSPRDIVKKCNFDNKNRLVELLDGQKNRSNQIIRPKPRLAARYKPWARSTIYHALCGAFLGSSMTVVVQKLCS